MAARRNEGPPASNTARLRNALLERAKTKFKALFGVEYTDRWGAELREHRRQLEEQDAAARKSAANIRRSPNKARALVKAHGLDKDPFRPGTAPVLGALALAARGTNAAMKKWILSEDPIARERPFASLRSFIIYFFETVPACSDRRGTFGDYGRAQRQGFNDRRTLTDGELVAIMICVQPASVSLSREDAAGPTQQTVPAVLARERREMKDARKKHGTEKRLTTHAQRAAERKKKALLPRPWDPTTSFVPPS